MDDPLHNGQQAVPVLVTKIDAARENHLVYTAANGALLGTVDCWFASPEAARAIVKNLCEQILGVALP